MPSRPNRTFAVWMLVALLLAAGIRFGYVLGAKEHEPLRGDQIYYSAQAQSIATGHWFEDPFDPGRPAADHAPVTALAVAPVSWRGGDVVLRQRLLMAAFGVLAVGLLGLLGRRLAGDRVGIISALLAAVYANLWTNDALVMSETFAVIGTAVVLLLAHRLSRRRDVRNAVLVGVAGGLLTLARAELILLVPALLYVALRRPDDDVAPLRRRWVAAVVVATLVVCITPWIAYNMVRFDEPTLISTQDGLTIAGANCADTYQGGGIGFWSLACATSLEQRPDSDKSELSARLRRQGLSYVGDHVGDIPRVVAARLGRGLGVWNVRGMEFLGTGESRPVGVARLGWVEYWVLVVLAGFGLRRVDRDARLLLLAPVALSVLIIAVFYGNVRFRISAEVGLVVFAACGLDGLLERTRRRLRSLRPRRAEPATTTRPSTIPQP